MVDITKWNHKNACLFCSNFVVKDGKYYCDVAINQCRNYYDDYCFLCSSCEYKYECELECEEDL